LQDEGFLRVLEPASAERKPGAAPIEIFLQSLAPRNQREYLVGSLVIRGQIAYADGTK